MAWNAEALTHSPAPLCAELTGIESWLAPGAVLIWFGTWPRAIEGVAANENGKG